MIETIGGMITLKTNVMISEDDMKEGKPGTGSSEVTQNVEEIRIGGMIAGRGI